ncbi:hypothetical protein Y032_0002g891 [Ancylostoma ceylanicum]|uniref:Uncharacterized protein n=1 Tax=Ancylostoma ceylanicum TaxID=53326 RepID=A0A016W1A3_9BILA|nr:hypothetical protein Y032_0002g891 [Ancylostoma ceylanicum]
MLLEFFTIAIFICGFLVALTILIGCIVTFVNRWRSSNKEPPKNSRIWIGGLFLVICAIMTLACLVLIGHSTDAISDGVELLPKKVKRSAKAVEEYVTGLRANLRCELKKGTDHLSDEMEDATREIQSRINHLRESLNDLEKKKKDVTSSLKVLRSGLHDLVVIGNAESHPVEELVKKMEALEHPKNTKLRTALLEKGVKELEQNVKSFGSQRKIIDETFSKVMEDAFGKVFPAIIKHVKKISAVVNLFLVENNLIQRTNYIVFAVIIFPLLLLFLVFFAFILLLIRVIFNFFDEESESGRRGIISHFGGEVMGATGYIAMIISILLFVISSIAFSMSFTMMTICVGFFEDKDLRVFRVTESIIRKDDMTISVSEIFYKCKNEYTFFDALDGSRLMAEEEMKDKIDLLHVRDSQRLMERGISILDDSTDYEIFLKNSDRLFEEATNGSNVNVNLAQKSRLSLRKVQEEVENIEKAEEEALVRTKLLTSKNFSLHVTNLNEALMDSAENVMVRSCPLFVTMTNSERWG